MKDKQIIDSNIQLYGCHLVLIETNGYLPSFVYSIGLYQKFGHPEIICFGLKTNIACRLINHACDLIKEGIVLQNNIRYSQFLQDYEIQFLSVSKDYYRNYVGNAGSYYGNFNFPLIQLLWPDKQHCFPWDIEFNSDWKYKQPLLDRNTNFKFYEERNLGVYTTKQVLEGDPILFVYHNEDGDWQFHTSAESNLADARLIGLEEILQLDPSINDLFDLGYGQSAWRKSKYDNWTYEG